MSNYGNKRESFPKKEFHHKFSSNQQFNNPNERKNKLIKIFQSSKKKSKIPFKYNNYPNNNNLNNNNLNNLNNNNLNKKRIAMSGIRLMN